jgi:uncharacterized membrane protein YdcZ (DUF606 family)
MEFWNNIINTALLGTDKKNINAAELSSALAEVCEQMSANEVLDKEEQFLQIAAVSFNTGSAVLLLIQMKKQQSKKQQRKKNRTVMPWLCRY